MVFIGVILLAIGLLLLYGLSTWLGIALGSFSDWLVALAIIGWLVTLLTVPWDIHFKAREVVATAAQSKQDGIAVDAAQVRYAELLARRSLWVALVLHGISGVVLYILAIVQLGLVGYVGAIAAVVLSVVRPAIAFYEFLAARLASIRTSVTYPREDVLELRQRVKALEDNLSTLNERLNPDDPLSWANKQSNAWEATRQDLARLEANQRQLAATQAQDAERLARQTEQAIAQLSADSQFLSQVRELIRFVKEA